MRQVHLYYNNKIKDIVDNKPEIAHDMKEDHNYIASVLRISYFHKISVQVLILISGSYFMGIFWYIFCRYT
jgi:hypothetical protein